MARRECRSALVGTYGTVTIAANGSWTYTLNNNDPDTNALAQGQTVTDVFNYTMSDTNGATSSTTLTITITGTNDAPVAVSDAASMLTTPLQEKQAPSPRRSLVGDCSLCRRQ